MASIVAGGIVATVGILAIGVLISAQPFLQPSKGPSVLLAFSIVSDENMPSWCDDVSKILNDDKIDAVVFFSGEIAEEYPDCVASFNDHIDIGSSTYHHNRLTEFDDYSDQLEQVSEGKLAVDRTGKLDSKSFKAPYGDTDENIYSLLNKTGVLADFSYADRYHKVHDGQFIWFDIRVVDLANSDREKLDELDTDEGTPIQINIDNSISPEDVTTLIAELQGKRVDFLSASELTGIPLTIRSKA